MNGARQRDSVDLNLRDFYGAPKRPPEVDLKRESAHFRFSYARDSRNDP